MSKRKDKNPTHVALDAAVAATTEAAVAAPAKTLRLPLPEAQGHNRQFSFVDGEAKSAAIALTAKGTNPKKARVYGYDNLADGGGVPKDKRILLVPGLTDVPKGVAESQWDALVLLITGNEAVTAATAKDSVTSRTIRRAYRAGYIRFSI